MMWTVLPPLGLEGDAQGEEKPWRVLDIMGRQVLCSTGDEEGTWRVERLLSTDPRDYLDPRFQPGQLIWWRSSRIG